MRWLQSKTFGAEGVAVDRSVEGEAQRLMLLDALAKCPIEICGHPIAAVFEVLASAPRRGVWQHVASELGLVKVRSAEYVIRHVLPRALVRCPDVLAALCGASRMGMDLPDEIRQLIVELAKGDTMTEAPDGIRPTKEQTQRVGIEQRRYELIDAFQAMTGDITARFEPPEVFVEFTGSPWSVSLWWMLRRTFGGRVQFRTFTPLIDGMGTDFLDYYRDILLYFGVDPVQFNPWDGSPASPEAAAVWVRAALDAEAADLVEADVLAQRLAALQEQARMLLVRYTPRCILRIQNDPVMPEEWHGVLKDAVESTTGPMVHMLTPLDGWHFSDVWDLFDRHQLLAFDDLMVTQDGEEPPADVDQVFDESALEGYSARGTGSQLRFMKDGKLIAKAKVPEVVRDELLRRAAASADSGDWQGEDS